MKKFAKFLSVLLALTMMMGTAPVFAAESYTANITGVNTDNHTYSAYQLFSGDYDTEGKFENIKYGSNVDVTKLINLLNAAPYNANLNPVSDGKQVDPAVAAAWISNNISNNDTNPTAVNQFAIALKNNGVLTGNPVQSGEPTGENGNYTYPITGLASGYYMIIDNGTTGEPTTSVVNSAYILQTVGEANHPLNIAAKASVPVPGKTVTGPNEGDEPSDWTDANIGDNVTFTLTSTLPKYEDYLKYTNGYKITFNDTMSEGLTYNNDAKAYLVTSDGEELPINWDDANKITNDGQKLTATFSLEDIEALEGITDESFTNSKIKVVYTAKLNEKAKQVTNSETNTVYLTYSNDPNSDGTGDSEPEVVKVYTYRLNVIKQDQFTQKKLQGAEFNLYQNVNGKKGEYYTFEQIRSDQLPDGVTADEGTNIYRVTGHKGLVTGESIPAEATLTTGSNGQILIIGLDAGDYILKETKAPEGYNKPVEEHDEFLVSISPVSGATSNNPTWTEASTTINNSQIPAMPETGGTGTKIFMAVGGVILVAGCVMLIAKKRREQA